MRRCLIFVNITFIVDCDYFVRTYITSKLYFAASQLPSPAPQFSIIMISYNFEFNYSEFCILCIIVEMQNSIMYREI